MTTQLTRPPTARPVRDWLMDRSSRVPELAPGPRPASAEKQHGTHAWWKVMCLTGVDYFSTLGYQPGIAALAAGALSPIATLVLVALTLFGVLPVYRRVARESPHGEGSIAMLERLLSFWKGKIFVLVLLGFAATDFIITMTLSAADATAHLVENPHAPGLLQGHQVLITLALLAVLGGVFLKGFKEAIGVAVALVAVYLALNVVVIAVAFGHLLVHPQLVSDWKTALVTEHGNVVFMVAAAILVFPKLALGLSGFETGVAVMPHIHGAEGDTEEVPEGRIAGAKKLLSAAAITMSIFLVTSSFVTTLLIPPADFQPGGQANGRALAYLAHLYLGSGFGTTYDLSTIAILWFAGASAMAGMLNLIPRYLPRYGMAPGWARAVRPLVLVLTGISLLITWLFDANVDAQGGAYATGVLVLMTSAAVAVTISARRAREGTKTLGFGVVSAILLYTTGANVVERPDGVKIGGCFIAAILLISLVSRLSRSFELRVTDVVLDEQAEMYMRDCARRTIRLVAHEPGLCRVEDYEAKIAQVKGEHDLMNGHDLVFVEVTVADPSDFETRLDVHGVVMHGRFRVLRMESSSVANALAALLLHIRDTTGTRPHLYVDWTEGDPLRHALGFLMMGFGEVAPVTREILRRAEPARERRPFIHAG